MKMIDRLTKQYKKVYLSLLSNDVTDHIVFSTYLALESESATYMFEGWPQSP